MEKACVVNPSRNGSCRGGASGLCADTLCAPSLKTGALSESTPPPPLPQCWLQLHLGKERRQPQSPLTGKEGDLWEWGRGDWMSTERGRDEGWGGRICWAMHAQKHTGRRGREVPLQTSLECPILTFFLRRLIQ